MMAHYQTDVSLWTSSANAADGTDRRMAFHKARQRLCPSVVQHNYTHDQPFHPNTRSFLYADDLCIATQKQSFEEVVQTLGDALQGLTPYYAANHLSANSEKNSDKDLSSEKPRCTARTEGCIAWETTCVSQST